QGDVARAIAAGIADDVGLRLGDIGGRGPHLDRVLAGRLDEIGDLLAAGGQRLRPASLSEDDSPGLVPRHVAGDGEIGFGADAARVVGDATRAFLELVFGDRVCVDAAAAGG